MNYDLKDYSYTLPPERIAQEATHPHHDARMMVIDRESWSIEHEATFFELPSFLEENRIVFFNDSRVLRSRLILQDVEIEKPSWERSIITHGEIFFLGLKDDTIFEALIQPGNKFKIGNKIHAFGIVFHIVGMTDSWRLLKVEGWDMMTIMEQYGTLPLPPYIAYSAEKESDYQTVFAKNDGSVAAPTASLHFTSELLERIKNPKEYITLHVGLGTFQWIKTSDIRDYDIHAERIEVPISLFERIAAYKSSGNKFVAVGTTVTRTLESLPFLWKEFDENMRRIFTVEVRDYWDMLTETLERKNYIHGIRRDENTGTVFFETTIYITPGYRFLLVDDLITNFHLPESSLLVLVSAFIGQENVREIYRHAIEEEYRFYSFGDGMYIRGK